MKRVQKLRREYLEQVGHDSTKKYAITEAIELLKGLPKTQFTESVEFSVHLGIDPRRSDQAVRGAVEVPHGLGKESRVAVFADGALADEALANGADFAGVESLINIVKTGDIPFDVLISHPNYMGQVGKLGSILGPKGLMPNPKLGTVSLNVGAAVRSAKAGQVFFRNDKSGIVHGAFGKITLETDKLVGNLQAVIGALKRSKPPVSKGLYIRQLVLSTTMGPGVKIVLGQL